MVALAIVGFIVLVVVGLYLGFAGFWFALLSRGLTGKVDNGALARMFVGIALIGLAVWLSPFQLVLSAGVK